MQLDDLKEAWATHGTMLERSLAINERLLREVMLRRVRSGMLPYLLSRALEVTLGIAALIAVMPILVAHVAEPRYVVATGALAVYLVGITASSVYLLVNALRLDYGGPVTAIQRDVERIRRVEYRALTWAVLGGVVVWLPAALVLFEVLTGVDAIARVDLAWLVANLVFGLIVLALGQMLSKKYVERPDLAPWARRLVDAVSGRALRSAAGHLAELSKFEREDPPPS
jgi:hypothetical protein